MKDKPVILIVDDQPSNIELLEAYLAPQDYEIVTATNGEEALGKLSGNQIDLILLDVMMPGMDGFEVTRRIRQDNTHRLLPIILVTVLRETEDRVKGIEAGCDDFISQPVDKVELLARVRSLLKVKAYNNLLSNYQKELEAEVTKRTEELKQAMENLQQDIIERKRAEAAVAENERKFSTLIGNLPGLAYRCDNDREWTMSFLSEGCRDLTGYAPEEIIGNRRLSYNDVINSEHRERVWNEVQTALSKREHYSFEYSITTAAGDVKWVWERGCGIFSPDGEVQALEGFISDVTERKRTEDALRQNEEKYRTILEDIQEGYFEVDFTGNFTFFNDSLRRNLGYSKEELMGMNNRQYTDKEHSKKLFQAFNKVYNTGEPTGGFDWQIIRKDGTKRYVEASVSLQKDSSGKSKGFRGIVRDVTERKQAEETIKKSEAKYRNIFENSVEGIYQSTIEGRFITANTALARMAGYDSPEELIEFIKDMGTQLYVHPEDRKRFMEIREAKGFVDGFEVEFSKKDGSTFWVVINARVVKDEQGKTIYHEGLIEDITIRKNAEEQLHQTLDRLKKAVGATIQVLVSAVESRDPYTAGHQKRVSDLARTIATEMGLAPDKIEGIRMAGSIHDIGKLSIPAEILSKPTRLTNIEFSLIKEHSQSGYEMLKNVESPWPLAQIVYQHHERINGSGYPRNLKGDEILIDARIMAVADVVEAMASHRPYRPTLGIEAALEEIEKNKGILYDDAVVDTCLRLFREKGYQLT